MKKYVILVIALLIAIPMTIKAVRRSGRRNHRALKTTNPNLIAVMAALKKRTLEQMMNAQDAA